MLQMGMQIAQNHLTAFDKLIGIIGEAGSGKSLLIKGMFPGLELTNDDDGVNVRPLPLLDIHDEGFYQAHTYHLDVRFEMAFTQIHVLSAAIRTALDKGKRVATRVATLAKDHRREEIARMLGGASITAMTMAHAAEMISQAQASPEPKES